MSDERSDDPSSTRQLDKGPYGPVSEHGEPVSAVIAVLTDESVRAIARAVIAEMHDMQRRGWIR